MPKKTKKQKIQAEQRRKEFRPSFQFVNSQISHETASNASVKHPALTYEIKSDTKPKSINLLHDYSYVKKDLIKITIFTIFALGIQCVLYFVLKGY